MSRFKKYLLQACISCLLIFPIISMADSPIILLKDMDADTTPYNINLWFESSHKKAMDTTDAYGRAYQLSVLLLVSANENKQDYENVRNEMLRALDKMTPEQNSKKAWLLGRVLVAAKTMYDWEILGGSTRATLRNLLNDPTTTKDEYSAWAWGYVADDGKVDYNRYKTDMMRAATDLTSQYEQPEKIEGVLSLSSVLWAWVMDLQAAADANDKETFKEILSRIKSITGEKTLTNAFSKGIPEDDYQAWALSIVYSSAQKINDCDARWDLYNLLADSKQRLLQKSKDTIGEWVLFNHTVELSVGSLVRTRPHVCSYYAGFYNLP